MKKTLTALALAALLTGCASDNAGAPRRGHASRQAKQPVPVASTDYQKGSYSWDAKPAPATVATLSAPADPARAVVSEIRGDKGLIALLRAEKPAPGSQFVLLKDEKALLLTIVEVDGESIIAVIPPNQKDIPTITVGSEVTLTAVPAAQ